MAYAEAIKLSIPEGLELQNRMGIIATSLATSHKANRRERIVIFTCGSHPTVLVCGQDKPMIFEVEQMESAKIVDTNGAGDAFVGGFLGAWIMKKPLEECVKAGHKLASISLQQVRELIVVIWFSWM